MSCTMPLEGVCWSNKNTAIWDEEEVNQLDIIDDLPPTHRRSTGRSFAYVCGSNRRGELGLGKDASTTPWYSLTAPASGEERAALPPVTAGSCGVGFTILCSGNKVYMSGEVQPLGRQITPNPKP